MLNVFGVTDSCVFVVWCSDSVLVTTDSFPVLQQLPSLRQLGLSRCYQIHPAALL